MTIKGTGATSGGKLLCEIDLDGSYWDDHNMHQRSTEPTCLYKSGYEGPVYEGDYTAISYLSGAETRAIALRLPAAIERYIEQCATETAANHATITA